MLVQFGNNWIQKIPLTAKLDSAYGLVQFWLSSEFFSSNYFQIGRRVVLLHILINTTFLLCVCAQKVRFGHTIKFTARGHPGFYLPHKPSLWTRCLTQ